jgi:hypothetical protein
MKTATAQEEIDGRWVDDNLEWVVLNENIRTDGTLRLCIAQIKEKRCVENVFTAYEILVYNAQGEEIWSGLWTGQKMAIRFRQPLPTAHKMEIKATKDFVINWMTGTKIHQTKPMSLTYLFP